MQSLCENTAGPENVRQTRNASKQKNNIQTGTPCVCVCVYGCLCVCSFGWHSHLADWLASWSGCDRGWLRVT